LKTLLVGKNSRLYKNNLKKFSQIVDVAISHADISGVEGVEYDAAIILSYSRNFANQISLIKGLKKISFKNLIVISSVSALVAENYSCYEYPKVKLAHERLYLEYFPRACIVRMGTVFDKKKSTPNKGTLVTDLDELVQMLSVLITGSPNQIITFCKYCDFGVDSIEARIHSIYSKLIIRLSYPCLLRPVDIFLRALGFNWYGYGVLSNLLLKKKESDD